jgi:hypothetical protein
MSENQPLFSRKRSVTKLADGEWTMRKSFCNGNSPTVARIPGVSHKSWSESLKTSPPGEKSNLLTLAFW